MGARQKDLGHIDVRYVAGLARLELAEAEIERFGRELDDVIEYVELLQELDLADVEPTAHAVRRTNILRDDRAEKCLERRAVVNNAPAAADDAYIRVPPVLETDEEGA